MVCPLGQGAAEHAGGRDRHLGRGRRRRNDGLSVSPQRGSEGGRCAALRAPALIEVERRSEPEPTAAQAIVRVLASGVCGTDVDIFRGWTPVAPGRVLGHEGAGVVERAPPGSSLELGAPVVIDPTVSCGRCPMCRDGLANLCFEGGLLGRELDGVFADWVAVPEVNLHPLPDEVGLEAAPLLQVLATVVHAQERVHVVAGRVAAVVGLGCAGQLHAQLLRERGARVFGVGRSESKRRLAGELGCEWTATPAEAVAMVAELDPRRGAGLVVEAAGTLEALGLALELVSPGGTILSFGSYTESGLLAAYSLYKKEVVIVGARASLPRDMEIAIDLVARGRVLAAPLISDRLPLDEAQEAITRSAQGALKVVMTHR